MELKKLSKKELNKIIETKTMYSLDYVVGIDKDKDYIFVNYLDRDWDNEPCYIVGTTGKDMEGDYNMIDSFTNKKHLIDYLVNDLEINKYEIE